MLRIPVSALSTYLQGSGHNGIYFQETRTYRSQDGPRLDPTMRRIFRPYSHMEVKGPVDVVVEKLT